MIEPSPTDAPTIVVDDAIAHADEAFAGLGRVRRVPAREIVAPALVELGAEILVVRSVTRIDRALLDATPGLRFVASATAGIDHVELAALAERGIDFAHAPGCNARAVAEWVLAALVRVGPRLAEPLARGPVGVVGYGQVGRRLTALLRRCGFEVLACDPPLQRSASAPAEDFVSFEQLWARCPIVSFHVPLIREGVDRTLALLDRARPRPAGPKLIINTSRGAVIPDAALDRDDLRALILDVWPGEPELRWSRLRADKLLLASPHVAGYSLEGKIAATRMVHEALSRHLGRAPRWSGAHLLPTIELSPGTRAEVLAQVVDLARDDARLRALAHAPTASRARGFEQLRRGYTLRREFGACRLRRSELSSEDASWLEAAGFEL